MANANSLRSQISCLYGRLEVPAEDQQAFLGKHGDCRPTTVDVVRVKKWSQVDDWMGLPLVCLGIMCHRHCNRYQNCVFT